MQIQEKVKAVCAAAKINIKPIIKWKSLFTTTDSTLCAAYTIGQPGGAKRALALPLRVTYNI